MPAAPNSQMSMRAGRFEIALQQLEEALAVTREIGNAEFESYDLKMLGLLNLQLGRLPEAATSSSRCFGKTWTVIGPPFWSANFRS